MLEIDGAHGEGGGQLVRTAVALAAIRGTPMRISNVRAGRRNPGLAPQHVAAVRAVASMCDAQCEGLEPRAAAFTFVPKRLQGGQFRVDVGTAGSITLVLQAMLPVAVASGARCRMSIRGGTDVRAAPPIDYLRWVLLPQLARMGIQAVLTVERRGYYPKGGGEVLLELAPARELVPFVVEETGPVRRVAVRVHVDTQVEVVGADRSAGPGGAIVLCAPSARTLLGAAQVAERGVRAERLGTMAAESLAGDLRARASLDVHAADQMLVFLALAPGESRFRARELSSHARTSMWLLERFSAARFAVAGQAGAVEVRVSR
jgi:RNA 3'-terminal phosphate cyclase (ATP)